MFARFASRRDFLWAAAGIAVVLLAVYGKSLGNDFVRWDDGLLIFENTAVRTPSLHSLWVFFTTYDPELYIPLTFVTYQITYLIGGVHAMPYHLVSLLFHGVNVLLLMWLTELLTRKRAAALVAGLVYAVHPLNVEPVAWASALKDLQSTCFFLASLIAYVRFREQGERRLYGWSLAFYVLALLSKVVVLTMPAVLMLLDWRDRRPITRAWLLQKLPYIALSAVFLIIALVGKQGSGTSIPLVTTALLSAKSSVYILWKFLVPWPLPSMYPYVRPVSILNGDILVSVLVLVALAGAVLWSLRKTREVAFGFAFFFVTILPWFYTFPKGTDLYFASDRFAYLPMIGLLVLAGTAMDQFFAGSRQRRQVALSVLGAVAAVLGFLTFRQALLWRDSKTLFGHFVAEVPDSYVAHNNLGNSYRREGNLDAALKEFSAALAIKQNAKVYVNMGAVYAKQGKEAEAVQAFKKAQELDSQSAEPSVGLGILYASLGKNTQALAAYARAMELNPAFAQAYINRGSLLADRGDLTGAAADFQKAIDVEPLYAQAYYNLAIIRVRQKRLQDALPLYEKAVDLQPHFIQGHLNLGVLQAKLGNRDASLREFRTVLYYQPDNVAAQSAVRQLEAM